MALTFACPSCGQKISAATDSGGLAVECPSCAQPSVVPTTISRASKIADRIENMLVKQDYVPGTTFMRLSTIGASTRMEVLRALFIVMAQTFQSAFRRPATSEARRQFGNFASATGGLAFRLASSVVPDSELGSLDKLHASDGRAASRGEGSADEKMKRMQRKLEYSQEEQRLQALVMSDAAWNQSETMESFVAFLGTLNLTGDDYWAIVYRRIGLACPLAEVPDEPVPQREPKKPWWQRLFG
jgi:hypothetical protein